MQRVSSGSRWEPILGYSRASIVDGWVFISATAATDAQGQVVGKGDFYAQTRAILDKLGGVLKEAGASYADVVQTRLYVTDIQRWQEVGKAHGEVFGEIRPAMTLVHVLPFLDPEMLVEIELTARLPR